MKNPKTRISFLVVASVWAIAVCVGMGYLIRYSLIPGPASHAAAHWPATSLTRSGPATLVLAVHPQCPCTDATLEELSRILAKSKGKLAARLLFYAPRHQPRSWVRSGLWRTASILPSTELIADIEGQEALRFGLRTSGEAALYDAAGDLVFRGGITVSRGHTGDNFGADAVVKFVNANVRPAGSSPVFGCSLLATEAARREAGNQ